MRDFEMTKYAAFDNTGNVNVVTGYYDTDLFDYGSNLPETRLQLTDDEWDQRMTGFWAVERVDDAWHFVSYTPPSPEVSLSQQAANALAKGVRVVSSSNSSLNGVYPMTSETRADITAEMVSLMLNQTFTNGDTTIGIGDIDNNLHMFDASIFPAFATAYGKHVSMLRQIQISNQGTLPTEPITIQ
jgi:hypothetical protein